MTDHLHYSPSEAALLRESFERLWPADDEARSHHRLLERFYERLFAKCPEVEGLFSEPNARQQRRMLFAALKTVVHSLEKPGELRPYLETLGENHRRYGAVPHHEVPFIEALLDSMAEHDPEGWTPQLEVTWRRALGIVMSIMFEPARS